ncbi:hypothetical protein DSECCO2_400240 [anaerobic digester metagenome]
MARGVVKGDGQVAAGDPIRDGGDDAGFRAQLAGDDPGHEKSQQEPCNDGGDIGDDDGCAGMGVYRVCFGAGGIGGALLNLDDLVQGVLGSPVFGARCAAHGFNRLFGFHGARQCNDCCVFLDVEIPMMFEFLVKPAFFFQTGKLFILGSDILHRSRILLDPLFVFGKVLFIFGNCVAIFRDANFANQ